MESSHRRFLETTSGESIPLGTIYCIGRNYAEHAKEMQAAPPGEPIVFIKPPSAYVADGGMIVVPEAGHLVHHEVEIVAVIGRALHVASVEDAATAISGYAIGIDVTLRDLQQRAKAEGLPWAIAKGFATSAPISRVVPVQQVSTFAQTEFGLAVNGTSRQQGKPAEMIWSVPELISFLSRWFVLEPGDVVFTGTPSGVGSLADGDRVHAWFGSYVKLDVTVHIPAE
jgi:fumarylpyruvate hydrolase